jgi:hypothetical protein
MLAVIVFRASYATTGSSPTPMLRCTHIHPTTATSVLTAKGEVKTDRAAGKLPVDLGVGIESVVDAALLFLVKDDLQVLRAVLLGAQALANNLNRVDDIGEDGIMDGCQSSRARALLLLAGPGSRGSLGERKNSARSEEQDVAVRELLLELARKASDQVRQGPHGGNPDLPLLHAMEAAQ